MGGFPHLLVRETNRTARNNLGSTKVTSLEYKTVILRIPLGYVTSMKIRT